MATWNDLINDRLGTFTISADASAIADANGIDLFLANGVKDLIEKSRQYKPQLLPLFSRTVSNSSNTYLSALGNIDVLKVTATTSGVEYFARYVTPEEHTKSLISGSIFEATSEDPIWTILDRTITVLPASGPSAYGYTYIDATGTVDADANVTSSNPNYFPTDLHYLLANYGAIKVLQYIASTKAKDASTNIATGVGKIGELVTSTADAGDLTDIQDALDKAQNLIDDATMGGDSEPQSAQYWLLDEDTDMVSSTISVAAQEISRANTIMTAMDKKTGIIKNYTDTADIYIKSIQTIVTLIATLQQEYNSFFIAEKKEAESEA